jgi:hypothetical protein
MVKLPNDMHIYMIIIGICKCGLCFDTIIVNQKSSMDEITSISFCY